MTPHIVITGPMGSGKTTLGRELAACLAREFLDSDFDIERGGGLTGRQIAATHGVAHLHRLESDFLRRAVLGNEPAVIAAAASVADQKALLSGLVAAGNVVILLDIEMSVARTASNDGTHRRPITEARAAELQRSRRRNAAAAGAMVIRLSPQDDIAAALAKITDVLRERVPSLLDGRVHDLD